MTQFRDEYLWNECASEVAALSTCLVRGPGSAERELFALTRWGQMAPSCEVVELSGGREQAQATYYSAGAPDDGQSTEPGPEERSRHLRRQWVALAPCESEVDGLVAGGQRSVPA